MPALRRGSKRSFGSAIPGTNLQPILDFIDALNTRDDRPDMSPLIVVAHAADQSDDAGLDLLNIYRAAANFPIGPNRIEHTIFQLRATSPLPDIAHETSSLSRDQEPTHSRTQRDRAEQADLQRLFRNFALFAIRHDIEDRKVIARRQRQTQCIFRSNRFFQI